MIVDRKQKKWAAVTVIPGVVYFLAYWICAKDPRGGSAMGVILGSAGLGVFIFECLLTLRKKWAASLKGRVQTWLRAHLWCGILSFLLVLMHSGFRWGNGLAAVLMWLLLIVVVSGLTGVALQHYLPRRMKEVVEREIIFEQIPQAIQALRKEADERIRLVRNVELGAEVKEMLNAIGLYLEERDSSVKLFPTRKSIQGHFGNLRARMPFAAHQTLKALENICEERRQLAVQWKLHCWLHGWLLMHVPLSFGLLLLTAVHAVLALRY